MSDLCDLLRVIRHPQISKSLITCVDLERERERHTHTLKSHVLHGSLAACARL